MATITKEQMQTIVRTMAKTAEENRQYFSELDAVMGDGDFGESLNSGFQTVEADWDTYDMSTVGTFLKDIKKSFSRSTGGCSGTVWGTLFRESGMALIDKQEFNLEEAAQALERAMAGITKKGGAVLGDKTVLDAFELIKNFLRQSELDGDDLPTALDKAAKLAVECKETTKGWVAKRGRQFFTGDRSIGTYDPGIVAVGIMATNIAEAFK